MPEAPETSPPRGQLTGSQGGAPSVRKSQRTAPGVLGTFPQLVFPGGLRYKQETGFRFLLCLF